MGIPWVGLWLLFGCAFPLGQPMSMVKDPSFEEGDNGLSGLEASGDSEVPEWDSRENAETSARMEQRNLERSAAFRPMAVSSYLKDRAVAHFNQNNRGHFFTRLESSDHKIKKAFGVMVYVTMVLVKTDCVKDEEQESRVEYTSSRLEEMGCQVLPESEQEQQECMFEIFLDVRSGKKAIVTHYCSTPQSLSEDHLSTLENS